MRRFVALVAAALALAAPTSAMAKSGYVRLPEPRLVRAGVPIPDSELSPNQILGGCGPKRVRDQITHKCRGPADTAIR
ncbi:MAG: hypothetical protein WBQ24_14670 [Xanthobacteraceae bacterium]|jgi:hypothetical protein